MSKFKYGNIVIVTWGYYKGLVFRIGYIYSPKDSNECFYFWFNNRKYEHMFKEEDLKIATKGEITEWLVDEL